MGIWINGTFWQIPLPLCGWHHLWMALKYKIFYLTRVVEDHQTEVFERVELFGSSTCLDETFTQHCYHFWQDHVQAKTFMSVQHWQLVIKVTIFKRFVVILAMFGISLSSSILCIYSSFILFYHPKISHICTWLTSHPISNYLKENQFANYLGTYVANWVPNIYCLIVKSILTTLLLYE